MFRDVVDSYGADLAAEQYFDKFTLSLTAGIGQIKYYNPVPFIETEETGFSSSLGLTVCPFASLTVTGSFLRKFDNNLYQLIIESME